MYKQIKLELADGEVKEFPFLACGTTSVRYKMIFGGELLADVMTILKAAGADSANKIRRAAQKAAENGQDEVELDGLDPETLQAFISIAESGKLDAVSKMAYVMSQHAIGADMKKLSFDGYLDWLDQFESMTFLTHAMDIITFYMASREGTSSLKKAPPHRPGSK